jgi:hypothetical protein
MSGRHLFVLVGVSSMLGACGALIGIQDIGVDPAAPKPRDSGIDGATGAPTDSEPPSDVGAPDVYTPPLMLEAGTETRRVFLTQGTWNGNLGGVSGANTLCNNAASVLPTPLGGSWVAWLSDQQLNAPQRLTWSGAYVTLSKVPIAATKGDLTAKSLAHVIDVMENGVQLADTKPYVWTGTHADGQGAANCSNWGNAGPGQVGIAGSFNDPSKWTDNGGEPFVGASYCGAAAHLYCFELQ